MNIDISAELDGYYSDTGISFVLGTGDARLEALCKCAEDAFLEGLKHAKAGKDKTKLAVRSTIQRKNKDLPSLKPDRTRHWEESA